MKIRSRHHQCKSGVLPLFEWADKRERDLLPPPVRRLAVRFNLSPSYARVLAEHAGFHPGRAR